MIYCLTKGYGQLKSEVYDYKLFPKNTVTRIMYYRNH